MTEYSPKNRRVFFFRTAINILPAPGFCNVGTLRRRCLKIRLFPSKIKNFRKILLFLQIFI